MPSPPTLTEIIDILWNHPENAEWTPKISAIPGELFRQWMASDDLEIIGFIYSQLGDHRFSVEPSLSLDEYLKFVRRYYERCFFESPDGEWSGSRYSAGWDLVNVLAFQWDNSEIPARSWKSGSDG